MRVAITGASGVVGRAVLRHLVEDGHEVSALSRSPQAREVVAGIGAKPIEGDVLDSSSLRALVDGCEVVFNVAGVNELCPSDPDHLFEVNVTGARNVLAACAESGVRRLVQTSSAVTLGEAHGTVGSETSQHRGSFLSEYERSKTVAERLLGDAADEVEVVFVNPSSVQGPGRSTGTGAILLAAARGRLPVLVDTVMSIVDIDDCARGHLLAAEKGEPGERYVLSGPVLTVREAVGMMNRRLGRTSRPGFIRPDAVRALVPLLERLDRFFPDEFPLCAESVRVLLNGHRYDGSRATRELGLEYSPFSATLDRTIDWFEETGLL